MKTICLLILANLRAHKTRTVLTTIATAGSICLLIWIISVYLSTIRSFDLYASRALGHYDLIVDPVSRKADRNVDEEAIDILRSSNDVMTIDPMWAQLLTVKPDPSIVSEENREGFRGDYTPEEVIIATDAEQPPFPILEGQWIYDDQTAALEVVISQQLSELLGIGEGDQLIVPGPTDDRPILKIIGVIEPPPATVTGATVGSRLLPSPSVGGIFCSMRDATTLHGTDPVITFVALVLGESTDIHEFRYRLMPQLYALDNPAQFMTDLDMEEEMSEAAKAGSLTLQAYVVGIIAVMLAFLVIFSTLSMGVSERVRQFALLRAIILTKRELALLIAGEGLVLVGLGLMIGIPAGWMLVQLMDRATNGLIRHGVDVYPLGILIAIAVSGASSLVAGILPAWRATRVKPLDAVSSQNLSLHTDDRRVTYVWLCIAVSLIVILPWLSFGDPPGPGDSVIGRLILGSAGLALGLLLLTPMIVRLVERVLAPPLAWLLGLPTELLEKQLSGQLWRTVACAMTLSIGMGLFAGIHIWGRSMVQVFIPTSWAPEATLVFDHTLMTEEVKRLEQLDSNLDFQPLIVEQPRLRDDVLNSAEFPSVTRQMVSVIIGIDSQLAFGEINPFIETEWVAGSPNDAVQRMTHDRGCVVPDHFLRQSGLTVGDELFFVPPESPREVRRYTIAGAVRIQGGQWMTKSTNMRQRTHRSAGLIFADFEHVKADFSIPGPRHIWVNAKEGKINIDQLTQQLHELEAKTPINRNEVRVGSSGKSSVDSDTDDSSSNTRVVATSGIGSQVERGAAFWLWFMSIIPLIAMAISSLAMLNMFLASVRARRWDFGILRSLGFTRSVLVRIVIAEGILVGLVACVIGCIFGISAGWSGTALTQATSWFGGMTIRLTIPVLTLLIGCLVMLGFAATAAIWPALRIAFTSPLTLLSHGRGQGQG
ncbi:MAG: ABC transporter permease [Planctomycetota bacterium]